MTRNYRTLYLLLGCAALTACATTRAPDVEAELDELTGVTVTRANVPLLLYRDRSAFAAHARDYVNIGPVAVNRMGSYRYYLWMGIWSTISWTDPVVTRDRFESIVLFVDGEPLPLDVRGWTPDSIGVSSPVYVPPVASAAEAYYEVTLDQIRMISNANDILLRTTGADSQNYIPWDRQRSALASMQQFAAEH